PATVWDLKKIELDSEAWSAPEVVSARVQQLGDESWSALGAMSLLETRAFFLERSLGEGPDLLPGLLERKVGAYYEPAAAVSQACSNCGISGTEEVMDTFFAFADLSLCTPLGNLYRKLRRVNRWIDVNPGMRFCQLLGVLENVGPFRR